MSLSSFDIETIVAAVLVILAYAYAAFWALNIRRNLTIRLYRHQALGIGLVSICVAYFTFNFDGGINYLPQAVFEYPLDDVFFFAFLACLVPLLYWTDSSLLAARDSDPLQRDVLGWARIRVALWGAVAVTLVGGGGYVLYQLIFLSQQTAQAGNSIYLVGVPPIIDFIAAVVPLVVPIASALIFLPVAARRTKDLTIRRHLKWFGLGTAFMVLGFFSIVLLGGTAGHTPGSGGLLLLPVAFLALFTASAYSLYRSAKAVISIYSFTDGT